MNDGINADFERPCSIPDTDTVEYHLGNLSYEAELAGFISIDEQKHTVALTTAKPVTAFSRILPMTVNLSRLTMGTMNSNAGHEKTSKRALYLNSTN